MLKDEKLAAICSFDKKTNIEIADKIIHNLALLSLTKIEDRMAIFTNIFAKIPSNRTNSLGRANFLATSFGKKLSWVRCEKADELAKHQPANKTPTKLKKAQHNRVK